MSIPARQWNELIDGLARDQVLGATLIERGGWQHPWTTTVAWDARRSVFVARIKPGFVAGLDPVVSVDGEDIALTDLPEIALTQWRSVGRDGAPTSQRAVDGQAVASYEAVPPYLASQGAGQPPAQDGPPTSGRLVRATEIFLTKSRIQTTTSWTFGLGNDGTRASFDLAFVPAPANSQRARISTERAPTLPVAEDPLQQLASGYQDAGLDKLPLATVFLLSPTSAFPGAAITGDWEPFVQHHCFWNVAYDVSVAPPLELDAGLGIPRGLGLGVADATIGNLAGRINDLNEQLLEFLNNNRAVGRFWSL